jgi:hypothetical protein
MKTTHGVPIPAQVVSFLSKKADPTIETLAISMMTVILNSEN